MVYACLSKDIYSYGGFKVKKHKGLNPSEKLYSEIKQILYDDKLLS